MVYAPVFPVPFLALAKMSLPLSATGMEASWIGDGFSQPFSKMPISNSPVRVKDAFKKVLKNTSQSRLTFEAKVFKFISLGIGNISRSLSVVLGRKLELSLPSGIAGGEVLFGAAKKRVKH